MMADEEGLFGMYCEGISTCALGEVRGSYVLSTFETECPRRIRPSKGSQECCFVDSVVSIENIFFSSSIE